MSAIKPSRAVSEPAMTAATVAMMDVLRKVSGPKTLAFQVNAGVLAPDHWYANVAEVFFADVVDVSAHPFLVETTEAGGCRCNWLAHALVRLFE